MIAKLRLLLALAFSLSSVSLSRAAEDDMKFNVRGANPGGGGAYTGIVELAKLSETTAKVRWSTGVKKEITEGIAIKSESVIGAAYGGKALYALAVYELKGDSIHALWTTAAKPEESGVYDLKGNEFKGKLSLAEGEGSVTFTPGKGGIYKVAWDLQGAHYDGIGVRVGNGLVAASGEPGGAFGVAGYAAPKGEDMEGLWATSQSKATGKETWSLGKEASPTPAKSEAKPAGDGKSVKFNGDTYLLKESKSSPGEPTSELREYLRKGEDWDGYRKMIALRMFTVDTGAAGIAKATLAEVKKAHPDSFIKEMAMDDNASTTMFIIVTDANAELNLWHYVKVEGGVAAAQFVMRNKAPYETKAKFKAEQDKKWDAWMKEIAALGNQATGLIAASAGTVAAEETAPAPPAKKSGKEEISPELVKAVKVDMDKCVGIAQKFMGHMQAGETDKAVALLSDKAFAKTSRDEFKEALEKSGEVLGKITGYKPDKSATKFGMEEGVMTFVLQADAEYEKAKTREILSFIRNDKGEVEFIDYVRTVKE